MLEVRFTGKVAEMKRETSRHGCASRIAVASPSPQLNLIFSSPASKAQTGSLV